VSDGEESVAAMLLSVLLRLPGGERLDELADWDPVQRTLVVDDSTDVPPGIGPHPEPTAQHPWKARARATAAHPMVYQREIDLPHGR